MRLGWKAAVLAEVLCGELLLNCSAGTAYLKIAAAAPGSADPVCVRAIVKQSDGTYLPGEWGGSSWPAVAFQGKAVGPTDVLAVATGPTQITVGKGPDYFPQTFTTNLSQDGQTYTLSVALQPQLGLQALGWMGGDAHVHFNHGDSQISRTPQEAFAIAAAGGLNFLSLCEEHYGATALTRQQMLDTWKAFENTECKIWLGLEEPKNQWGHHVNILYDPWAVRSAIPYSWGVHNVHEQGGVSYPVHPDRFYPDRQYNGVYSLFPINNHFKDFPIEALAGHLLDAWSGVSDEAANNVTLTSYFKLLSMGYKIPLLADSDFCFDRVNNQNKAMGFWLDYYQLEGNPLSRAALCNALRKGRVMATTGPLVLFSIDNAISGDSLPADGAPHTLRIQASYQFNPWTLSYSTFDGSDSCRISEIDLVRNGQVVNKWTPDTPTALIEQPVSETASNAYYFVRVLGNESIWMAGYASPIYFETSARPRQPPVFKPLISGRLYDASNGSKLAGTVSCVRFGKTEWTIPTDSQGFFRANIPIDADLVAQDSLGRTFTQNIQKYEPAYSFCHYLADNYPSDKGPAVDAFSNLVQQMTWEFPMGLQLASSYVRANLAGDAALTNLSVLSAPAPFSGKSNTEIVMLLVDKTQAQPGDTINYAVVFRQPQNLAPTEQLGVAWRGWDPNYPRINTKYETVFLENSGTSGHIALGGGFYMRGGSVVVPAWPTNDTTTTAAYVMFAFVRSGAFLETAHLLLPRGPTRRELLVSTTSDGFPATWGQLGIGPCNFYRDDFSVRYSDYRASTVQLNLNGAPVLINPKNDTAHVADADDAIFYENFYYDANCEPQYRNIPFRDPVRTQPADPDFSNVAIQNPPDATPPTVALLEPFNGDQADGNPARFYYNIDDAGLSGPSNATLYIDGVIKIANTTANPISFTLAPGSHTWQVKGCDNAGNWALSELRTVAITGTASNAPIILSAPLSIAPNEFQFQFNATPGQNYTVLSSSNFSTWPSIFVTNAGTNVVNFTDFGASNSSRYYRILRGP